MQYFSPIILFLCSFLHKTIKISLIFVYQYHFYLYFCGSFGIKLQDEEENQPTRHHQDADFKQRNVQPRGVARIVEQRGHGSDSSHTLARPEAIEGGKGIKHDRKIRVCTTQ